MKFGTAKKDVVVNSGKEWLHGFKNGETKVRFLQEIDDWILFREHYTPEGKSFPCTTHRDTCPGCTDENERTAKSTRKYATNLLDLASGRVRAYKMPITLVDRLATRAQRNGGITNRDYIVIRSGSGLETEYDVEQDEKYDIDFAQYESSFVDIEGVLADSFREVHGTLKEVPKAKKVEKLDPPSNPVASPNALKQSEDEIEVDEETVRTMKRAELITLYAKAGVEVDEDLSTKELAENLIKQFSE